MTAQSLRQTFLERDDMKRTFLRFYRDAVELHQREGGAAGDADGNPFAAHPEGLLCLLKVLGLQKTADDNDLEVIGPCMSSTSSNKGGAGSDMHGKVGR